MTDLGLHGAMCWRCEEDGNLLVEFTFGTQSPFTQDSDSVTLCRLCLDEFVTGKVTRVKTPVDPNGLIDEKWNAFAERNLTTPAGEGGTYYYYRVPTSDWPQSATLRGWTDGHV